MDPLTPQAAKANTEQWPERLKISIWMVPEDDHWVALSADFNVAGMARTDHAALHNLLDNLHVYLASFRGEDRPFADAYRPIARRETLRLRGRQLTSHVEAWRRQKVHHSEVDLSPVTDGAVC
jgi:hypothetical protein